MILNSAIFYKHITIEILIRIYRYNESKLDRVAHKTMQSILHRSFFFRATYFVDSDFFFLSFSMVFNSVGVVRFFFFKITKVFSNKKLKIP